MSEKEPMLMSLWMCVEEVFTYDDYENVYIQSECGMCDPSTRDALIFLEKQDAEEEALKRTKNIFRLYARHCFAMNTSFFRGCPDYTDLALDELDLVVSRFSRLSGFKNRDGSHEKTVDKIEAILIDKEDPDREMLVNIMAEVFHTFYMRVFQVFPDQIAPKVKEEIRNLSALKKNLETEIACLIERKKMMEAMY